MTETQKALADIIQQVVDLIEPYCKADDIVQLKIDLASFGFLMSLVDGDIQDREVEAIADMVGPINGNRFTKDVAMSALVRAGIDDFVSFCAAPPVIFDKLVTLDKAMGRSVDDGTSAMFIKIIGLFAQEVANSDGYIDNGEMKIIEAYITMLEQHVRDLF